MNYNIYTVLNSEYIKFGKVFLRSLVDTHDMNNIKNIFILDTGLNDDDKSFITTTFKRVQLIKPDEGLVEMKDNQNGTNVVCSKTYYLKKLIERKINICPIVMIDIDCLFLRDIKSLINPSYDFQVCQRGNKNKPLLASFMVFNSKEKSLKLLEQGIEEIQNIEKAGKETKALINIYKENKDKFNFGFIPLNIVSALYAKNINKNTRIIHFKSSSNQNGELKIDTRLTRRGLGKYSRKYV